MNLRAPITAVGPLISSIKADLPYSGSVLGLLTTIPLIMFAVFSPFVRRISDRFGAGNALLYSILLVALGVALRSYAGVFGLFSGTVLLGAGVAIGNVLVPGIIKSRFPDHLGIATGAFTISMTSFAAISAAVSYPVSQLSGFGWRNSLAIWLVLLVVGLFAWLPQRRLTIVRSLEADESEGPVVSVWKTKIAWWVTILMGAQSFLFYFFTAWLPSIAQFKGFSPETAGYMAFAFQLTTIPAALVIPPLAARMKDQRGLITMAAALYIISLAGLVFSKSTVILTISVMLYGFATGCCFNLCMLLISLRTANAERATSLSGMVQSLGYAFGATGPILGGWLFDLSGNWNLAYICVAVLIAIIFVSGRQAGKNICI